MKKLPCEKCGAPKAEAHHLDYDKPSNILWLCAKHHKDWHNQHDKVGWRPRRVIRFSNKEWRQLESISRHSDKEIGEILKELIHKEYMAALDKKGTFDWFRKGMGQSAHNNLPPGYTDRDL